MKQFDALTYDEIKQSICGHGITVDLIYKIIKESNSLVDNNYIDTEVFSPVFIKYLEQVIPQDLKSNGDWACGYITADNLNRLMNPNIVYTESIGASNYNPNKPALIDLSSPPFDDCTDIKINPHSVAPGAYEVKLTTEQIDTIKGYQSFPKDFFHNYCSYLITELGAVFNLVQVYDYRYVIKQGWISDGSHMWHNDKDVGIDAILMIYIVDPEINEQTGMRLGCRDNTDHSTEKYLDIQTGTAYLVRQDDIKFEHKVEKIKGSVNERSCISISLYGFDNISKVHGLIT